MFCKKCEKENEGDFGEVHYGKKIKEESKTMSTFPTNITHTITTYKVLGNEKIFFCNDCIYNGLKKSKLINLVVFLVSAGLVPSSFYYAMLYSSSTNFLFFICFIGGISAITAITSFILLIQKLLWRGYKNKYIDNIAINIKRKELGKNHSIYTFWDRYEFKKLTNFIYF